MKLLEKSDENLLLDLLSDTRGEARIVWLEANDTRSNDDVRAVRRGHAEALRDQSNALLLALIALDVKGLPPPLVLQEGGQSA